MAARWSSRSTSGDIVASSVVSASVFVASLPGPAPRFSVTPGRLGGQPRVIGEDTGAVLRDWGVPQDVMAALGQP
mgnify:CR=1 FL=1